MALAGFLASECAVAQTSVHHQVSLEIGAESATVRTTIAGAPGGQLTVGWPAWQPGALQPTDLRPGHRRRRPRSADGNPLTSSPPGDGMAPNWGVQVSAGSAIFEFSVPLVGRSLRTGLGQRNSHDYKADDKPASIRYFEGYVLDGADTWPSISGLAKATRRITFDLPPGFGVHSTLTRGKDGGYSCADHATLVDSTMHLYTTEKAVETLEFATAGRRHRVHLTGFARDRFDRNELRATLIKIIDSQTQPLGPAPVAEYSFLFGRSRNPVVVGHGQGMAIGTNTLRPSTNQLLNISRVHLQAWLRALRPDPDLQRLPDGRTAWFDIGVRDYLAELTLVRAGLQPGAGFWTRTTAAHVNTLQRDKRRLQVSAVDAGAALFSGSKRRPRPKRGPDLRAKGFLLGMLLDVEIRIASGGKRSLENAVQGLTGQRRTAGNDAIRAACEAAAGAGLGPFFARSVDGTEELPLTRSLARIGIVAAPRPQRPQDPKGDPRLRGPRRRPPRWQVTVDGKASPAAIGLRQAITRILVK